MSTISSVKSLTQVLKKLSWTQSAKPKKTWTNQLFRSETTLPISPTRPKHPGPINQNFGSSRRKIRPIFGKTSRPRCQLRRRPRKFCFAARLDRKSAFPVRPGKKVNEKSGRAKQYGVGCSSDYKFALTKLRWKTRNIWDKCSHQMCSHQMGPNWPSAKLPIYRVRQWRCDKISKSIFSGMENDFELKFDTLIDPSLVKTLTNFCGDNFNHLREKWFFPMPLKI